MKFVQLIRKVIKVVATRCQILRLKCSKFDFGWGSAPDPAGGAYSTLPDPLIFEGPISKGGEGKGRDERGGEGMEGRGEGGEGRGEEAFLVMWPRRLSALNPPLCKCARKCMISYVKYSIFLSVDTNGTPLPHLPPAQRLHN